VRDGVGLGLVGAGVDDDMRAFPSELQRRSTSDIAAGAGDQGDFPVELTHATPHKDVRACEPFHITGADDAL